MKKFIALCHFSQRVYLFEPMLYAKANLWHKAPFLRLLIPFIAGIILQWHLQLSFFTLLLLGTAALAVALAYNYVQLKQKFSFIWLHGLVLHVLLIASGALAVWTKDIRHNKTWFGNHYTSGNVLLLTIEEPLVEKTASYKAVASVQSIYKDESVNHAVGNIIIYFKKEEGVKALHYGSQIIIAKPLQAITNSGNPGAFDYNRYSLFNGITHQAYLTQKEYEVLPHKKINAYKQLLFNSRSTIVSILQKYIKGEKEQGLAEALLIGYKDDLDKKLIESYSNTGVVHVIAISGLHLGIIYWLLLMLTKPLKHRRARWLRFALIVSGLWAFSLLAGAQPSVLRSAVMFSAIALSTAINRQSSIYNTLALSAFVLLLWNPYWIWDVGFQLSYSAVLSIILFFRPIYNWLYFPNKAIDFIWKLMAVSIAAQILTLPISVYHFHQFPFLFLFANLIAVPLSSLILIGEIILCILSPIQPVAAVMGNVLYYLIKWMNGYVERLDEVSFAVWDGLSISSLQVVLLYVMIGGAAIWLMEKRRWGVWLLSGSLLAFTALRSISFIQANGQQKIIVYNVPRHQAIDVIVGRKFYFIGDKELAEDDFLRNFHIQPSRVLHRINETDSVLPKAFTFVDKQVLIIDTTIGFQPTAKLVINLLILSKNPKLYITDIANACILKQVVADGSVPQWKAKLWKRDCDSLRIPFHHTAESGAFVMQR